MRKLFIAVAILCLFSLLSALPLYAYPQGQAGSVRNDSDGAVKILIETLDGGYEFIALPPKVSLDLPAGLIRVRVEPHLQNPLPRGGSIHVVVWDPDGRRRILTEFGQALDFSNLYPTAESDYLGGRNPEGKVL